MANERMTDREAMLVARIKHLEDAAKAQAVSVARGNVFEATWRTINALIPTWLAGLALAVFLIHHGFVYYLQAQIIEAETQFRYATADVEKARAKALNDTAGDEPMRLTTLRAELAIKQAEAARATVEARAQSAQLDGETARLATLKAQLANLQNQATLARAKANAEGAKFGWQTLEQRAVRAKLILQQLEVIHNRVEARYMGSASAPGGIATMYKIITQAYCEDNQFADLIDCPAQYIGRKPTNTSPQVAITGTQPRDGLSPTSAVPGQSQAFQDGANEAVKWQNFLAGLTGAPRDGAEWWSSVRSQKPPTTCERGPGASSAAFRNGCNEARNWLTPVDRRRNTEPDFRAGFNSRF